MSEAIKITPADTLRIFKTRLKQQWRGIADVEVKPNGEIYAVTVGGNGKIKIENAGTIAEIMGWTERPAGDE